VSAAFEVAVASPYYLTPTWVPHVSRLLRDMGVPAHSTSHPIQRLRLPHTAESNDIGVANVPCPKVVARLEFLRELGD
jgi:hypothetical protein